MSDIESHCNPAQRIAELERENAELKAYLRLYDQSDQLTTEPELRKSLVATGQERDQLRAHIARLRMNLEAVLTVDYDARPLAAGNIEERARVALREIQ